MSASLNAPTPVNLYEANLALSLRVGELFRIDGQKWIESGTRLYDHAVTDSAEYAQLGKGKSGPASSSDLGEVYWRHAKRRTADAQAAGSLALERQRSLADGLREAMTTWGTAVNGAMLRNDGAAAYNDAWSAALTKWTQGWQKPRNGK